VGLLELNEQDKKNWYGLIPDTGDANRKLWRYEHVLSYHEIEFSVLDFVDFDMIKYEFVMDKYNPSDFYKFSALKKIHHDLRTPERDVPAR